MVKPIEEIEAELRISAEASALNKIKQKRERVQCSACRHKNLAQIDGLLTLGIPVRTVATNYALTRSAAERHKQNHLPTFPMAEKARSVIKAEKLLAPLIEKLKTADEDNLLESTWPVFDALWKAFENTLDDSPKDWLLLYLAKACIWLYRIRGRDYDAYEANLADVREAIQVLELWWDRKGHNSAVKQRGKHRNTVDQAGQTGQRCRQGSEA